MAKRKTLKPGSYSHGTLVDHDVFMNLVNALSTVDFAEANRMVKTWDSYPIGSEERDWIVWEEMFDKLGEHCPEGYYFGAHPGDGADFGVWENEG